jgi:DnaJ-class molecular chaperone
MAEAKANECHACKGSGKCRSCKGRGVVIKHAGAPTQRCPECQGSGECPVCGGKGTLESEGNDGDESNNGE